MKAAVITRHAISNYGSLLQAVATQKIIEDFGHECEIIDYIRDDESYKQYEKTLLKKKDKWNSSPLRRMLYLAVRQPFCEAAGKYFEKARKRYLKMTIRYTDSEQLKANPPKADVYVTGSDQVWGHVADGSYDDSYCLSFTDGRKTAYAASFGHSELTDELRAYYKKMLSSYEKITVREDSAVRLLADMGISAKQVLDPTLLLDKDRWREFIGKAKKRRGRYVLVYQIHNDKRLGEYAACVAKSMGLPLIRVSASFHQIARTGKLVWCPSVAEFLQYIDGAECMITDSFHGTAYAINLNTPFVEVLPNNNTGTRNLSLLSLTGLTDRVFGAADAKDGQGVKIAHQPIDWESVNAIIEKEREKSLELFREMLSD